jgi:hypothetical protein
MHNLNRKIIYGQPLQYKDVGDLFQVFPLADEFDRKRKWLKHEAVR